MTRKKGMFGSTNDFLVNSIDESAQTVVGSLKAVRKAVDLAEIALDEMKMDLMSDYLGRKIELTKELMDQGYDLEQVTAMLEMREK